MDTNELGMYYRNDHNIINDLTRSVADSRYINLQNLTTAQNDIVAHIQTTDRDVLTVGDSIISVLNTNNLNLHNRLCDFEKTTSAIGYENRIKLLETQATLAAQIAAGKCSTEKEILESRIALDKEIVLSRFQAAQDKEALSRQIEECCCETKMAGIQAKLEATQDELDEKRLQCGFDAVLAKLACCGYNPCSGNGTGNGNGNSK